MPFSAAHATNRRDDVGRDRARADEEAPAQRDPERRRRARVDRADPLPRALDAAPHRRVEDAAARDLEAGEPGAVEDLRDAEDLAGRDAPGERLLREQPDRRVDELRHGPDLPRAPRPCVRRQPATSGARARERTRAGRGTIGTIGTDRSRLGRYRRCPVGGWGLGTGPETRRPRERSGAGLRRGRCSGASRGSTLIRSPMSTKSGTWTTAPVSSVAGFVTFETVSPRTPGSVSATASSTDAGSWMPDGLPSTASICTVELDGEQVRELVRDLRAREPELLVRLLVHEVRLGAVVVEELDVLHLGVDARELLARAERVVDDGAGLERLELRAHERAALAGLHVLELDDAPDRRRRCSMCIPLRNWFV